MAATYHGCECKHCGSTEKYRSSKSCVQCTTSRAKSNPKSQASPEVQRKAALKRYHKLKDSVEYKESRIGVDRNKNAKRRLRMNTQMTKDYAEEINRIYKECPVDLQVDHVVPLNGKFVSGLHVPWNLQYLSPEDNNKKSNKFTDSCA